MGMTGTIDPDGRHGGPVIDNPTPSSAGDIAQGMFDWQTMPEVLQDKGVSWKVYSQLATNNNVLAFFSGYTNPTSPLCQNALLPTWPGSFDADVATGTLPQVSWVLAPTSFDEHPPPPMAWGEWVTSRVVSTLVGNPGLWAKTLLVISFDENGGYFDHVAPPTPAPGTAGEYLTLKELPSVAGGIRGPVGLGFRVPALLVPPFTRGGYVCSDVFDHTSMLKFLEIRFGVHIPNISAWRRRTVGDLTTALDVTRPNASLPPLPAMEPVLATQTEACGPSAVTATALDNVGATGNPGPVYPLPDPQRLPRQERGSVKRRGDC
jgi:phospholipase C